MPKIIAKESEFIRNSNIRREGESHPKQPLYNLETIQVNNDNYLTKYNALKNDHSQTFPSTNDTANLNHPLTLKDVPLEESVDLDDQESMDRFRSVDHFNKKDQYKRDQAPNIFVKEKKPYQVKSRSKNVYQTPFHDFYGKISKPKDEHMGIVSEQDFGVGCAPKQFKQNSAKPVKGRVDPTNNKISNDNINQRSNVISFTGENNDFGQSIQKSAVNNSIFKKSANGSNNNQNSYRLNYKESFGRDFNIKNNPSLLARQASESKGNWSESIKSPELKKSLMIGSSTENNPFYLSPKFSMHNWDQVDAQSSDEKNDELSENRTQEKKFQKENTQNVQNNYRDSNKSIMNRTQEALQQKIQGFTGKNSNFSHLNKENWARNPQYLRLKAKFLTKCFTARAYASFDVNNNQYLWSENIKLQRQVASLTKMMTYYTSTKVIEELGLNINIVKLRVSVNASNKYGTTAELYDDDILTIKDLLYGMMLPSGNDAAQCLCENLGQLLRRRREPSDDLIESKVSVIKKKKKKIKLPENVYGFGAKASKVGEAYFLKEMNKHSKDLGMLNSNWANPHGNYPI